MAETVVKQAMADLIRPDAVDRRVYSDPTIFQMEMERLFSRTWTLVGHDSQIPEQGDYFQALVAQKPIFLVRDGDQSIKAFLNACPHRGAPLCNKAKGNARRIVCPYHNWTFKTDGSLIGVPLRSEYDAGVFNLRDHGLASAGQVGIYRGFIFVSPDPATDLLNFLGGMRSAFDDLVDRAPDLEVIAQPTFQRHRYRANWKLIFENLNDSLHLLGAHASAATALEMVKDQDRLDPIMRLSASAPKPEVLQQLVSRFYRYGHSYSAGIHNLGGGGVAAGHPHYDALAAARGKEEADRVFANPRHMSLLYPSATINARMGTVRLVRPIAVDDTEVIAINFRLKGAPDSVFQDLLNYSVVSGSPGSFVLADDIEIFERSQELYRHSDRDWNSVHRGTALTEATDDDAVVANGTSEAYIRNQFSIWSAFMDGSI